MQDEFNFAAAEVAPGPDGLTSWRAQRLSVLDALARANGLPIGHRCHIELHDGTSLDGLLQLETDKLILETERNPKLRLRINRCTFAASDISSVSRAD